MSVRKIVPPALALSPLVLCHWQKHCPGLCPNIPAFGGGGQGVMKLPIPPKAVASVKTETCLVAVYLFSRLQRAWRKGETNSWSL